MNDAEAELIAQLGRGDSAALPELYRRLAPHVHALALSILRSREEAEEVVQDTFVKLTKTAAAYQGDRGSVRAFVYTLARNEAFSRLRARRARPQGVDWTDHDPLEGLAAPEFGDPLSRAVMTRALGHLQPQDRQLLEEAYYLGYSHSELAVRLGWPLGTVKSRLRHALGELRARLERR